MLAPACRKFRRLASEREDRDLLPDESRYFEAHLESCAECRRFGEQACAAMNLLRGAAIMDVETHPMFDQRVIRRAKSERVRESLTYWSPALVGAVIAGVTLFATLAMVTMPSQLRTANLPSGSARRFHESDSLPSLELDGPPRLLR